MKRKPRERLYNIWLHMKDRCNNPNCNRFKHYGGRGIKVCEEWSRSFSLFREWALQNGYCDNLTIDRIDVNGNYEPMNCRWLTQREQCYNRRNNRRVTFEDKTQTVAEWAREMNIKSNTLLYRLRRGWEPERALCTAVGGGIGKVNYSSR